MRPWRGATAAGGSAIERRAQTKGENRTGDSTKPGEVRGEEIFGAGLTEGGVLVGGPLVLTAAKARGILLVWQLVFMELFFLKAGFILS